MIKKLDSQEIDVAFITYPYVSDSELEFHPLVNDKLVLLISRSHPLAARESVSLSELAGEKFLIIKSSTGFRNSLITRCREIGFEPDVIFESGTVDLQTISFFCV